MASKAIIEEEDDREEDDDDVFETECYDTLSACGRRGQGLNDSVQTVDVEDWASVTSEQARGSFETHDDSGESVNDSIISFTTYSSFLSMSGIGFASDPCQEDMAPVYDGYFDLDKFVQELRNGLKLKKIKSAHCSKTRTLKLNSSGNIFWDKRLSSFLRKKYRSPAGYINTEWPVTDLLRVVSGKCKAAEADAECSEMPPFTEISLVFSRKVLKLGASTPREGEYLAYGFHCLATRVASDPSYRPWLLSKRK